MIFLSTIFYFAITITISNLIYYFIAIPVIPCCVMYIYSYLSGKKNTRFLYNLFLILLSIYNILNFGTRILYTIYFYPDKGNIISIIFDAVTLIAIISATIFNYIPKPKVKYDLIYDKLDRGETISGDDIMKHYN